MDCSETLESRMQTSGCTNHRKPAFDGEEEQRSVVRVELVETRTEA